MMTKPTASVAKREEQREVHMANAGTELARLLEQARIRNIDGDMVATVLIAVLASRNATLAGKVLMGVEMAIQKYPVVRIIPDPAYGVRDPAAELVDIRTLPDYVLTVDRAIGNVLPTHLDLDPHPAMPVSERDPPAREDATHVPGEPQDR